MKTKTTKGKASNTKTKDAPPAKPAKKTASPKKESLHKVGDIVIFTGYTDLEEGADEFFTKGQPVRITEDNGGKYKAEAIELAEDEDELATDTVYDSECRNPKEKEQKAIDALLAADEDEEDEEDEEESDESGDEEDEDEEDEDEEDEDEEDEDEEDEEDEEESDESGDEEDEDEEEAPPAKGKKGKAAPVKEEPKKKGPPEKKAPAKADAPAKKGKAAKSDKAAGKKEIVKLTDTAEAALSEFDGDAIEAAIAMEKRVDQSYFDFGGLLAHINATGAYTLILDKKKKPKYPKGKSGFRQFLEDTFQTDYRTATYLIDIYKSFVKLGKGADDFASLGWSKAKEFTKDATEKNVDKLIAFAKAHTRAELVDYLDEKVRVSKDEPGEKGTAGKKGKKGETRKVAVRRFKLFEGDAAMLDEAIATVGEGLPDASPETCLVQILTEWAEVRGVEIDADAAIASLENRLGVKFTVVGTPQKDKAAKPAKPAKKGKAAPEPEEEDEDEEEEGGDDAEVSTEYSDLGEVADADPKGKTKAGKAAIAKLEEAAEEYEIDSDEYETWAEFGEAVDNLIADLPDEEEEEEDEDDA